MHQNTRRLYKRFTAMSVADLRSMTDGVESLSSFLWIDEGEVESDISEAHGHTRLKNLFADYWPVDPSGMSKDDQQRTLEVRVADAKSKNFECLISDFLGIDLAEVHEALSEAHGRTIVSNAIVNYLEPEKTERTRTRSSGSSKSKADRRSPSTGRKSASAGDVVAERYTVRKLLGQGGFGYAVLARDEGHPNRSDVVLKFPHEEGREALLREFVKASQLTHHNIVKYLYNAEDPVFGPFLVMSYGGSSVDKLYRDRPMTVDNAIALVQQASNGLDYLHGERHLHGDVSPGNILISEPFKVRLSDFGLSRALVSAPATRGGVTTVATRGGTAGYHPIYSALEVRAGNPKAASDQYSLAMVFCACLLGIKTFEEEQRTEFARLTTSQNAAVAKALNLDPGRRFLSCADFANALTRKR